jgi:hypothetical protein
MKEGKLNKKKKIFFKIGKKIKNESAALRKEVL